MFKSKKVQKKLCAISALAAISFGGLCHKASAMPVKEILEIYRKERVIFIEHDVLKMIKKADENLKKFQKSEFYKSFTDKQQQDSLDLICMFYEVKVYQDDTVPKAILNRGKQEFLSDFLLARRSLDEKRTDRMMVCAFVAQLSDEEREKAKAVFCDLSEWHGKSKQKKPRAIHREQRQEEIRKTKSKRFSI